MVRPPRLAVIEEEQNAAPGFRLELSNFSGPFDLLLNLIGRRELDITEISLSAVTDEFISYLRGLETVIGRTVKFPDASVAASPITTFAPEHPSALAYRQLARELIFRGAAA